MQKVFVFLNLFFFTALLFACLVPYTSFAGFAFFSLMVPILVFVNILFVFYWLMKKSAYCVLSFGVLLFGYYTLGSFVVFSSKDTAVANTDALSILSFNALGFRGKQDQWKSKAGDSIVQFVFKEQPDIICFQEFDYRKIRSNDFNDYPYKFVDFEFGVHSGRVVQAIYSKYKIINTQLLDFPKSGNSAVYSDIVIHKDTVRVYNLHLESLKIRPSSIKKERSDKLFWRLRSSFAKQEEQSIIVKESMNTSPYPIIVCGDFNANQFSKAYINIKGVLNDSFLEKGSGYGATIHFWKFPFRIDFILVDPKFRVLAHKNYDINLSDHEPIMALIKMGANE